MPKLFIDTNIYLDFYRETDESIATMEQLLDLKDNLIITEQVYREFLRNRNGLINDLINKLRGFEVKEDYSSPILSVIKASKDFKVKRVAVKKKIDEIVEEVNELQNKPETDPILSAFLNLYNSKYITKYMIEDHDFHKAWRRKMLGDPPFSRDKSTIGDEVNWEILLARLEDDLILVAKDSTYFDSQYLLKEEFMEKRGKELKLITKKLSDALEMMKVKVTDKMKEAENNRINEEKIEKKRALELLAIDMVSASTLSTVTAGVSNEINDLYMRNILDNARRESLISLLSESGSVKRCKKCGEEIPDGQDKCPACKE